jgi:hypothetical protein
MQSDNRLLNCPRAAPKLRQTLESARPRRLSKFNLINRAAFKLPHHNGNRSLCVSVSIRVMTPPFIPAHTIIIHASFPLSRAFLVLQIMYYDVINNVCVCV